MASLQSISSSVSLENVISCYCDGGIENGCDENNSCPLNGGQCFMAMLLENNEDEKRMDHDVKFGCLDPEEGDSLFQCKSDLSPHAMPTRILCCDDRDFCNMNMTANFRYNQDPTPSERGTPDPNFQKVLMYFLIGVGVVFVLMVIIFGYWWYRHTKKGKRKWPHRLNGVEEALLGGVKSGDYFDPYTSCSGSMSAMVDQSSGSGSGAPMLVQRTIARQIQFEKQVGKGRFGEVYTARWNGEMVAAKVFQTTDEASWNREKEIYQTMMLQHENILSFIAADIGGNGGTTHMLLITAYHEHGSLHDFLKSHTLDYETTCRLAYTAAAGLAHLHVEIHGTKGKPGIAHRDLKSKNILVKQGGVCVIADFGLAVRHNSTNGELDIVPNPRQGTIRYMAPEVLTKTINLHDFEAYKRADMYAFSLVLWEIATRCAGRGNSQPCPYKVPYEGLVPPDPSFEEMRTVVCKIGDREGQRPPIYQYWLQDAVLTDFAVRMEECWHGNPNNRLTALNVKKKLADLQKLVENCNHAMPYEMV